MEIIIACLATLVLSVIIAGIIAAAVWQETKRILNKGMFCPSCNLDGGMSREVFAEGLNLFLAQECNNCGCKTVKPLYSDVFTIEGIDGYNYAVFRQTKVSPDRVVTDSDETSPDGI